MCLYFAAGGAWYFEHADHEFEEVLDALDLQQAEGDAPEEGLDGRQQLAPLLRGRAEACVDRLQTLEVAGHVVGRVGHRLDRQRFLRVEALEQQLQRLDRVQVREVQQRLRHALEKLQTHRLWEMKRKK